MYICAQKLKEELTVPCVSYTIRLSKRWLPERIWNDPDIP